MTPVIPRLSAVFARDDYAIGQYRGGAYSPYHYPMLDQCSRRTISPLNCRKMRYCSRKTALPYADHRAISRVICCMDMSQSLSPAVHGQARHRRYRLSSIYRAWPDTAVRDNAADRAYSGGDGRGGGNAVCARRDPTPKASSRYADQSREVRYVTLWFDCSTKFAETAADNSGSVQ